MVPTDIKFHIAETTADFEKGKQLFADYAASLNIDLSFQDFSKELETISQQYHSPQGGLILVSQGVAYIGCAGIRKLEHNIAELKRMYINPDYRGLKIGTRLLERSVGLAKQLGYTKIRLDTLAAMVQAQALYRSFGFYEIPAYRFNPLPGTIYMEKEL